VVNARIIKAVGPEGRIIIVAPARFNDDALIVDPGYFGETPESTTGEAAKLTHQYLSPLE
jgi:hypothetical protein